jgi:integrase
MRRRRGRGEGAVFYSASKGCWVARAVVGVKPSGSPKYREVTAKSKGDVLAKKTRLQQDAAAGRLNETSGMTAGQYLGHWLENTARPSVAPTTWASYERCVRLHLIPRIGGIRLAQLRPVHVESLFRDMQRDGMSGGNSKKVSEVLSTALQHATRIGALLVNPAGPVAKPRPGAHEIVPFTPEEIGRIRAAAVGHRLEGLILLAISTGAREGELLALGWEHVDWDHGEIHIRRSLAQLKGGFLLKEPKSQRGRRGVEVPGFVMHALRHRQREALAEGTHSAPAVFCTKTGNFIGKSNFIRQVYALLLARAGVVYRKFHTFRHTHVSELLAGGEDVLEVARRVGDRPEVILKTYAHRLPRDRGRIVRRLEEMYAWGHRRLPEFAGEGGVKVESPMNGPTLV